METKYYIDSLGMYIGGFEGDTQISLIGYIEIPMAPDNILDTWNGTSWTPYVP